jgi:hypothetical protein
LVIPSYFGFAHLQAGVGKLNRFWKRLISSKMPRQISRAPHHQPITKADEAKKTEDTSNKDNGNWANVLSEHARLFSGAARSNRKARRLSLATVAALLMTAAGARAGEHLAGFGRVSEPLSPTPLEEWGPVPTEQASLANLASFL